MKIIKNFIFLLIIPILAILLSYLFEYYFHIPTFSVQTLIILLIIGIIVSVAAFMKFRAIASLGLVISFLLVPYISFLIGPIDVYMVDDNLAQGIKVIEVRPTIEKIEFTESAKGTITALQGPKTLKLHPGENEVYLGSLSLVSGSYTGMKISLGTIEVDLTIDMNQMAEPEKYIPADVPSDFSLDKTKYYQDVADKLGGRLEGSTLHYTYKLDPFEIPVPLAFPYPTGTGGPDVILDIILGEDGLPATIKPKLNFPPGTPVPEQIKNLDIIPQDYVNIQELQSKYKSGAESEAQSIANAEAEKASQSASMPQS